MDNPYKDRDGNPTEVTIFRIMAQAWDEGHKHHDMLVKTLEIIQKTFTDLFFPVEGIEAVLAKVKEAK